MARAAAHTAPRRAAAPRRRRARSTSRVRVWMRRAAAVAVLAGIATAAYMVWLRDSSLVAVRDVKVTGLSSAESREVRAALADTARGMTTLHVREDELRAVARSYPTVESVSADARFPNGLSIAVRERRPVGVLEVDGRDLPVSGDGTLLPGISTAGLDLPAVEAGRVDPSAPRVTEEALDEARALGAAPDPLRSLVERAGIDERGVVLELSNGIELVFGDGSAAEAKWAAAARVLADRELGGLSYLDVRAPDRPAVGGASAPSGTA